MCLLWRDRMLCLLRHGCAELASAQHTISPERVYHLLMVKKRQEA